MNAKITGDRRDGAPATLGDILYAEPSVTPVSEDGWAALVRYIASGDQYALHVLYERTHRLVFTLSMRITQNRATAEEVTLDVFHDVWRRSGTYDPAGGTVVGWIMNQARSRAIDRVRFEQRKKRVDPHIDGSFRPEGVRVDPAHTVNLEQERRTLQRALALLSPEERQAIETAFFSELTHLETAVQLGEPLGTVKTRIRSGLQKLRETLVPGDPK